MKSRDEIIAEILSDHEAVTGGPDAYSKMIAAELSKRLTESSYLTCEDFDHFDVNCCSCCCHEEPHFALSDVTLDDDRHAFVCCAIAKILTRQTKVIASDPDQQKRMDLWDSIFGAKPDPIEEQLHLANLNAATDEERLSYCLQFAHRASGRKRGLESLETLVERALQLPGRGPAKACSESDSPPHCGLCMLCGGLIYPENMIPGTVHHNCARGRELDRERGERT